MPYELKGNCVHKKGQPKPMKCYDNRRKAVAYLQALEANVSEQHKFYAPIQQEECQYTELTTTPGQACANCRFFEAWENRCHLITPYPKPITITGWCNKWEAPPEPEMEDDEMEPMGERTSKKSVARSLFQDFANWLLGKKTLDDSGFKFLDNNRFAVWWTNNYEDNDGEIFPAAELDTYIGKVEQGDYPYPTLQFAHLSGTDHGKTDHLWRVGNFALATGTFDETPAATKWKAYHAALKMSGAKIGISHRYWFNEKQMNGKAYGPFQTFEISWFPVVPGVKPANPLTSMEIKTMPVKIPDKLRESMKQDGGFTDAEIDALETTAKQLDERAIAERRAAKTEGDEQPVTPQKPTTEDTQPVKAEPEKPAETPTPDVPAVDEAAVKKAVDEAEAKWQTAFKTYQDKTAADLQALTQAVSDLTTRINDGFALKKPASKSIWTIAQDGDEDVADMEAAKAAAKKGKRTSIVGMMAGENEEEDV